MAIHGWRACLTQLHGFHTPTRWQSVQHALTTSSPSLLPLQLKGLPEGSYSVLPLDCASLESVRQFAEAFRATGRRLDALVCNAAVYLPTDKVGRYVGQGPTLGSAVCTDKHRARIA